MSWRLARSLKTLLAEVNTYAPSRDKTYDGTIGDAAHAARASRHNPNSAGVVCALDITHDPDGGMDAHLLARRLSKNPHPNLAYIISDHEKASQATGWKWTTYGGTNPHTTHAHFAVGAGTDSNPLPPYDDTTPWCVGEDDMTEEVVKLLKELIELAKLSRVSEVARSYDVDEIRAVAPIEVEKIKADRDREVEAERKRLKL